MRALDNINLSIKSGEFISVIGHSGSGKSTLMNIIGCLDIPTYGQYCLEGEKVETMSDKKLSSIRNKHIGFIFQNFNLIPSLTAIENVELPLLYRGIKKNERKEIAEKALERVGLQKRMFHYPKELSGGQQQRVAIARAIASKPPLILADEPTGNLDSRSGSYIIQILKELHNSGRTIVLITHDSTVANVAQRTVMINDGHLNDNVSI